MFLISLEACGSGLNLSEADYCFLLASGSARRLVYRLVAKDTIEEKVMALKKRKAELFTGLMDAGDVFGSSLDADDIRALIE